jgi:hypothetical protein
LLSTAEVTVGGGDYPDVHARRADTAHRLEFAFLEHTQELGLKLKRHVANFIEKEGAMVRERKSAHARIDCTRKGSAFVPEKLGF